MAGPSASDVRAILSLPNPSPNVSSVQSAPLARKPSVRKPEGMPRELYQLIGPSAPTLTAQFAKPQLKQKPNLGGGGNIGGGGVAGASGVNSDTSGNRRVRWEWRAFRNGARGDTLKLSHWTKASTDANAEYPFAKYNVQPNSYVYSQDEYTRFLEDKEWSKEETDHLFELVREFDGRFYVVGDRYDFPNGPQRSLEDMKERYYSVCRKLIRNRPWPGDDASKAQMLSSFQFDKEREVTRKKYVASLESRTPEQIAEEEALYIELKRLEQTERKFKKDRDELLRTILGIESGLPDVNAEDDGLNATSLSMMVGSTSASGLTVDTKKARKKGGVAEIDTPVSASSSSNVIQLGQPVPRKQQSTKNAAYDALHCIVRTDVPATTTATTTTNKAAHTPVYLRSFKTPAPKTSAAPKIAQVMAELHVSHTRLVMPTRDNCQHLEGLLEAASALVEIKKLLDKVELDIRLAKARLARESEGVEGANGNGGGSGAGTTRSGSGEGGTPAPMDIDEDAEGEQDETVDGNERGQSVASARSGRGRKQARRSMSISSVDTAGNGPPNKRKKR